MKQPNQNIKWIKFFAGPAVCLTLLLAWTTDSFPFGLGDVLKEVEKQSTPPVPPVPAPPAIPQLPTVPSYKPPAIPQLPTAPTPAVPVAPTLPGLLEQSLGGKNDKASKIVGGVIGTVQAMQPIGLEEEKAIGGALATEVLSRFGGSYPNLQLQKYVSLVGQAVVQVSDRANIPYHFAVLNSEEPNAFATPGGYIFVSRGLMRLVENEAQLAGVLGHEIAHISQKHALQTIQRSKTLQGMTSLSMALMNQDPKKFSQLINEVSDVLFTRGLDHDLEYEADHLGMEFAIRTGYHPGGLKDFIRILAGAKNSHSIFFSTHPSPRDRFVRLNGDMERFKDSMNNATLAQRYKTSVQGQL